MVSKSKTGLFALGFFVVASFFIILAFVSPYWLVTDGKLKNPKFIQIGKLSLKILFIKALFLIFDLNMDI